MFSAELTLFGPCRGQRLPKQGRYVRSRGDPDGGQSICAAVALQPCSWIAWHRAGPASAGPVYADAAWRWI